MNCDKDLGNDNFCDNNRMINLTKWRPPQCVQLLKTPESYQSDPGRVVEIDHISIYL